LFDIEVILFPGLGLRETRTPSSAAGYPLAGYERETWVTIRRGVAMRDTDRNARHYSHVAEGAAGDYTVSVLASIEEEERFFLIIENSNLYLTIGIDPTNPLNPIIQYLTELPTEELGRPFNPERDEIKIGFIGNEDVLLLRDTECESTVYCMARLPGWSVLRYTIEGDGFRDFRDALAQL
jgi:hypothetical protein